MRAREVRPEVVHANGIWFAVDAVQKLLSFRKKSLVSTPWRYISSKETRRRGDFT